MSEYQIIFAIAVSFFVVGGLARASGRRILPWITLSLLTTPLLMIPLLLAHIIIRGRLRQNDVVAPAE